MINKRKIYLVEILRYP